MRRADLLTDPLISCLMVTRGALFPARFAIAGFLAQTHLARELVIVSDTPSPELVAHIAALGDPRIRMIRAAPAPLGSLRNIAVSAAQGEIVAQWDDDDLYAPNRLSVQLAALRQSGDAAILLVRWTIWWPDRYRLALSGRRGWEGTLLGWKDQLLPYPDLVRGEDSAMINAMLAAEVPIGLIDRPDLYCYVVHGGNSWNRQHFRRLFDAASQRFEYAAYDAAMAARPQFAFADYLAGLETATG